MGEWMSILETPSQFMRERTFRMFNVRRTGTGRGISRKGMANCSEIVWDMEGDVANMQEIEGIDFNVMNPDLLVVYSNLL